MKLQRWMYIYARIAIKVDFKILFRGIKAKDEFSGECVYRIVICFQNFQLPFDFIIYPSYTLPTKYQRVIKNIYTLIKYDRNLITARACNNYTFQTKPENQ